MFNKNSVLIGFAFGLILPAIAWLIFTYLLKNQIVFNHEPVIPYLVAIALNLVTSKFFFKKDGDQTGTGILISTFTAMAMVFYFQNHLK